MGALYGLGDFWMADHWTAEEHIGKGSTAPPLLSAKVAVGDSCRVWRSCRAYSKVYVIQPACISVWNSFRTSKQSVWLYPPDFFLMSMKWIFNLCVLACSFCARQMSGPSFRDFLWTQTCLSLMAQRSPLFSWCQICLLWMPFAHCVASIQLTA